MSLNHVYLFLPRFTAFDLISELLLQWPAGYWITLSCMLGYDCKGFKMAKRN